MASQRSKRKRAGTSSRQRRRIYLLTIRKSRVKEFTTFEQLREVLLYLITTKQIEVLDVGYHILGTRYNQAHIHAYIYKSVRKPDNKINNFFCHYNPHYEHSADKYIHSEDWDNEYQLDNIENENYYMHNYNGNWV